MKVSIEINPSFVESCKKMSEQTALAVKTWATTVMVVLAHCAISSLFFLGREPGFVFAMHFLITILFYAHVMLAIMILCDHDDDGFFHEKRYPLVYLLRCDTWRKKLLVTLMAVWPFAANALVRLAEYIDNNAAYAGCFILLSTFLLPFPAFCIFDVTVKE